MTPSDRKSLQWLNVEIVEIKKKQNIFIEIDSARM